MAAIEKLLKIFTSILLFMNHVEMHVNPTGSDRGMFIYFQGVINRPT